jgi:hypothetical protein
MTPAIEHNLVAEILFWALMLPISAYILHVVAGYCTDDYPTSFRSALFIVLLTAAAVFFTFDLSSYFFALFMRDPTIGVRMPANYTYWDWLREPIALKWHVLGFVPLIRCLPVLAALVVGCIVQIFVWKVDFKIGAVVFVAQVVLNLAAMVLLSMLFRFGLEYYERFFPPQRGQPGEARAAARNLQSEPAHLQELGRRVARMSDDGTSIWRQIDMEWESVNGHLRPLYGFLQPVTNHLPYPAQSFLNAGGWLLILVAGAGLIAFAPRLHRHRKEFLRPRAKRKHQAGPRIKLALIGDSVSGMGSRQATVDGVPARLRLAIMVPSAAATGPATAPAPLDQFLDAIRPKLSALTAADYPHVEVWSDSHARTRLHKTLEARVEFPEKSGEPSPWVILIGQTTWSGLPANAALGFLTSAPRSDRIVVVPLGEWAKIIGARDVPSDERE